VKTIIEEIVGKLKDEIEKFVEEPDHSLGEAEKYFSGRVKETVTSLLSAYYEEIDTRIRQDKAGRKAVGLQIERLSDTREVLTQLGTVRYRRTYYKKVSGGYEYPVDSIAEINPYQRVSESVGLALVENAEVMSYSRASDLVTNGVVSRQTVMNKIRSSHAAQVPVLVKRVPVIHIDADEDHVALQTGKRTIVPLISCYEGIAKHGKRGECVNIFHISEYGLRVGQLWEKVSDELDRRYDLSGTKIYLHGDGASWIRRGLEYLPNCTFVLDRYHVNKYMKQAVAGFEPDARDAYLKRMREAEIEGDFCFYESLMKSIEMQGDETNAKAAEFLLKNFDAIHIYHADAEARNGGATEPHVSHILSSRLSSRPMGWSAETLKHFAPILASGLVTMSAPVPEQEEPIRNCFKHYVKPKKKKYIPNSIGLPDPDIAVFPRTRTGHRPYALNLLT